MRRFLPLLVLLCLAFAPAPLPRRGGEGPLQGRWQRVKYVLDTSPDRDQPGEVTMVVSGRLAAFWSGGEERSRWRVRPAGPGRVDLVGLGHHSGSVLYGVYKIDGDALTWRASPQARPDGFGAHCPNSFTMAFLRAAR